MRARLLFVLVFLTLAWGASGCFHSRELALMKRDLASQAPGLGLDHQFTLSLGSFSIGFARLVTKLVPEEEVHRAGKYLHDIRHVEVALYEVEGQADLSRVELPGNVRRLMKRGDWVMAVKVQEEDSRVWVFYREYFRAIRDMYIVVLSEEELVMVRLEGRLDRIAEAAIRDYRHFLHDEAGLGDFISDKRP